MVYSNSIGGIFVPLTAIIFSLAAIGALISIIRKGQLKTYWLSILIPFLVSGVLGYFSVLEYEDSTSIKNGDYIREVGTLERSSISYGSSSRKRSSSSSKTSITLITADGRRLNYTLSKPVKLKTGAKYQLNIGPRTNRIFEMHRLSDSYEDNTPESSF